VGGIPEVVEDGRSGLLVTAAGAEPLAAAVTGLLDEPARRRRLGSEARRRAETLFSAGAVVPGYEALYRRVLATSAGPS
jgi:glycosyltransferase involved in cell wall biosynthesis